MVKKIHNPKPKAKKFTREPFSVGANLKECESAVIKAQNNIALAKRNGDLVLAETLGKQLVETYEARVIAVRRVVTNKGARSAGLSVETLSTVAQYERMIEKLGEIIADPDIYTATPLDRIYIPKPDGKLRPISIPSYTDRCLQALYMMAIDPIIEEDADLISFGFRPIRSTSWAAGRAINSLINPLANYRYIVEVDITGCYNNISHDFLSQIIPTIDSRIFKQWLKCGYVERGENSAINPTDMGVPQGGIISPTLANMTLDGLDEFLKARIKSSITKSSGGSLIRYADDMVFFTTTREIADLAVKSISEFLQIRNLEINKAKTKITDLSYESFKFVGFEFKRVFRRNRKIPTARISIPLTATRNLRQKIHKIKKEYPMLHTFIDKANPIIRGWANYYRFAHDSIYVFRSLRFWLWKQYYSKAYRIVKNKFDKAGHEKIHKTIMDSYFSPYENYETWPIIWENKNQHILFDISSVHYVKPTYTMKSKNPYILTDRIKLQDKAMEMKPTWHSKVLNKWECLCGLCGNSLSVSETSYELHHILPREFGGSHKIQNMVPLCSDPCHLSITVAVKKKDLVAIEEFRHHGVLDIPYEVICDWSKNKSTYE